jgi:hypothetical protein
VNKNWVYLAAIGLAAMVYGLYKIGFESVTSAAVVSDHMAKMRAAKAAKSTKEDEIKIEENIDSDV